MSYNNCGSCTYCPRILAYSSTRTTYQGNPIGMSGLKNIETMDNFATILQGNKPAVGQDKTFILCHDNPCEAVPLIVNDQYNGDGKAPVIPGDNSMSKVFTPAGMYMEVFEDYNYGGKRWVFGNRFSDMVFGLYWFGAQNRISSFIIKTAPQSVSVMMCQDYDCSTGKVWRSVGSYKKMPAEIGDDDLSRVVLPPKFSIECFVHSGFKGHSRLFENGHATASLSLELRKEYIWWNDKVSSYTIATID